MNYYFEVLRKFSDFSGRASREEYWYFFLINFLVSLILRFAIEYAFINPLIGILYSAFILVPGIAVAIRRMHDVNKTGWYVLIPIYNVILACTAGTVGDNDYGDDPYEYEEDDEEGENGE